MGDEAGQGGIIQDLRSYPHRGYWSNRNHPFSKCLLFEHLP